MGKRKFEVELYEPAINPGGYYGRFVVRGVEDADEAIEEARIKADEKWPDHGPLDVFRISELKSN